MNELTEEVYGMRTDSLIMPTDVFHRMKTDMTEEIANHIENKMSVILSRVSSMFGQFVTYFLETNM